MCVCASRVCSAQRPEEPVGSPETGVKNGYKLHVGAGN